MRPELILWDWNGTLLDDVELCENALNRLCSATATPAVRPRAVPGDFGFPVEDYYVRAGFDFTRHSFAELAESYMEDYIPASAACPLMAGPLTLEAFKNAGLRQVILSASPVTTLTRQVEERGVTPYFDRLLGLGDIYAKSKVEVGLAYLQEAGFDPAKAVMIGDSVHDFEVAQALGVGCVLQSRRPPAARDTAPDRCTGGGRAAGSGGVDFEKVSRAARRGRRPYNRREALEMIGREVQNV